MRVLVLYAHPDPESFGAALHRATVSALQGAGHAVDDCDLYAEEFDPVLPLAERRGYHDPASNRAPVARHVDRLMAAEALVLVYPVWNFGFPAILKGYLDRVFLPGVSFRLDEGRVRPNLRHLKALAAVTTYGGPRWRAALLGDPPRRLVGRVLRGLVHPRAAYRYLALYDMNRRSAADRATFLARVEHTLGAL
ncbi:MAG TPA: NAD(P)H-dependent oxidoreductase [Beijerinckiaceae bacterium]|jgi:putative NADPH-quinone reductase